MAQTKVIIVYSVAQNLRRRVIFPDDDSEIDLHSINLMDGEDVLVIDIEDYNNLNPDAALGQYLMAIPQSDRHCIVHNETNEVIAVVNADSNIQQDIDAVAPHYLIPHYEAVEGWIYNNGAFVAPAEIVQPPSIDGIIFNSDSLTTTVPIGLYSQTKDWPSIGSISIVDNIMNIGCESHAIEEWRSFKDSRIKLMDYLAAAWWGIYKPTIMDIADKHLSNCANAKVAI